MKLVANLLASWMVVAVFLTQCGVPLAIFAQETSGSQRETAASGQSDLEPNFSGSLRIVKLLWNTQPEAAVKSLRRTIEVALDRDQLGSLIEQLSAIENTLVSASGQPSIPQHAIAVATLALVPRHAELRTLLAKLVHETADSQSREFLLRVWLTVSRNDAFEYGKRELTTNVGSDGDWQLVVLSQAFKSDRGLASQLVLQNWKSLPRTVQVAAVEPLSQQVDSMRKLVAAVGDGLIPKDFVNTNQLREWLSSNDQELVAEIGRIWGQIRWSDDGERQKLVKQMIERLNSSELIGNTESGWAVFQRVCSQCHVLHGKGFEVGPNITANGRGNFEQLVSNVLDPSLVIGPAFQARIAVTTDGEVLTGLLVAEDAKRLTLKVQGGKTIELNKQTDIEQLKVSPKSLMPEGLEQQINQQELCDLFALLCLTKAPGEPDNETIAGTPPNLISFEK